MHELSKKSKNMLPMEKWVFSYFSFALLDTNYTFKWFSIIIYLHNFTNQV